MSYRLVEFKDQATPTKIVEDEEANEIQDKHLFSSMTCGYDTIEELKEKTGLQPACCECGHMYSTTNHEPTKSLMLERNMCFYCNLWFERMSLMNLKKTMIVDHCWYSIAPDSNGPFKGFGGREFKFEKNGETIVSHNTWYGGEIPKHFWERIPDNAKIIR